MKLWNSALLCGLLQTIWIIYRNVTTVFDISTKEHLANPVCQLLPIVSMT